MKRSDIKTMPQYFEKYINQVDDLELSQAFDDSIKQLNALDKNLLAKLDGKRYAPGKWTAKETLQHVIDFAVSPTPRHSKPSHSLTRTNSSAKK